MLRELWNGLGDTIAEKIGELILIVVSSVIIVEVATVLFK